MPESVLARVARIEALLDDERSEDRRRRGEPQQLTATQVKEHIEALLHEKDRALDRARTDGDARLHEHIETQVRQIRTDLDSAEKLELARVGQTQERIAATEKLLAQIGADQQLAQDKFEETVQSRFKQVNEFRAALEDLGKQMATRRELETSNSTSAERYDQINEALGDLRSRIDTGPEGLKLLQSRIDVDQGGHAGSLATRTTVFMSVGALAAFISMVIVLANVLTTTTRPASPVPVVTVTSPTPTTR